MTLLSSEDEFNCTSRVWMGSLKIEIAMDLMSHGTASNSSRRYLCIHQRISPAKKLGGFSRSFLADEINKTRVIQAEAPASSRVTVDSAELHVWRNITLLLPAAARKQPAAALPTFTFLMWATATRRGAGNKCRRNCYAEEFCAAEISDRFQGIAILRQKNSGIKLTKNRQILEDL